MNDEYNLIFKNKKIIVGVTASIAAYKAAEICSNLVKLNSEVFPVLTPNSLNFISPLTLSSITGNKAIFKQFENESKIYHISLSHQADIILIAPATANTISKLANGICDNFLTTTVISSLCPVVVAPAMNEAMYLNNEILNNILKMTQTGKYFIVEPQKGRLACGQEGIGKLADIEKIIEKLADLLKFKNDLKGKKVLITAGATREFIDSVRYISNLSSGKMGFELAQEAYFRGAQKVIFITSNKSLKPYGVELIYVQNTEQMLDKINKYFNDVDIIIMAAAVSDVVPETKYDYKLKKSDGLISKLIFKENINILNYISERKKPNQFIVGFSAESGENIENTKNKMSGKNIDMMVLNDISRSDIGFESDFNEVIIITKDFKEIKIEKSRKRIIARNIYNIILNYL